MSEENNNYENETANTEQENTSYVDMGGASSDVTQYDYSTGKGQGKGLGIASMVCGIVALITCCMWCTVIPLAVVAIVLGIVQIVKNESKGMAIAGIICGAFALILFLLLTVYGNYMESSGAFDEIYDILRQNGYY